MVVFTSTVHAFPTAVLSLDIPPDITDAMPALLSFLGERTCNGLAADDIGPDFIEEGENTPHNV
ncbi:hypothetical protein C450_20306 [Halococcus salifodinae DSM 8989]|uniref:Uncharacterized protein n=1 Tax=Halococcus salifodinae DSM 8989 TaxID=1227456 RepID=M0MQS3_9EURY|nr:hypothetical protein C450_20306 [Halococcus salifodinae DSM 8989]